MNLYAIWPYFVLMMIVMGVAALPLFRFVDSPPQSDTRFATIDGLRGFLALGVFVFHLAVTHRFIEAGVWEVPAARFYALLGPIGVSLFFMITGFLFWGKMLRANGRIRWTELYIGRLFRIAPMYLLVVLAMLCIVFARTGFRLQVAPDVAAGSILQWLALGIIDTQPDVNGYRATHVLAGVTWTISYEWAFYASLLATSYFARGKNHLLFVLGALIVCVAGKVALHIDAIGFSAIFLCGMTVASLLHENLTLRISRTAASTIALLCLAAVFAVSRSGYGTFSAVMLSVFFYFVCSGASLFGLLNTTSAQRLGNISYSLYLMQGLVLTLVFSIASIKHFALDSPQNFWVVGSVCACLLLVSAALGYAFLERPGIALGKRITQRRASMTAATQHVADSERVA